MENPFTFIQIPARTLTVPFVIISADKPQENRYEKVPEQLRKFVFKPGNKANPLGRPKGKSMKEFARDYLQRMSYDDRIEFLNNIDSNLIWKMAEGNPQQDASLGIDVNKENLAELTEFLKGIARKK